MNMDQNPSPINLPVAAIMSGEPLTMSSREIADLCEKRHDHVMRDIKKMLADLGMPAPKFGGTSMVRQPNGGEREVPCFNLPKDLTLTLVAGYNVVLRKRIIDRWLELEGQGTPAMLTGPQLMAAALIEANATMQAQAQQIEAMQDDVDAFDRLAKAEGSLCITDAAKALQMRRSELFQWLRENGWIFRRPGSGHDLGYSSKTSAGLLEHKVTTVLRADGSEKVTEQVRVTPRGLAKLAKLIFPSARLIGGGQ